jgi:hypothetical protein
MSWRRMADLLDMRPIRNVSPTLATQSTITSRSRSQMLQRHSTSRLAFLILLAFISMLTLIIPASAPASVVLGVYSRELYSDSGLTIEQLHTELGTEPQIAMYYQDWNPGWSTALINPKITSPLVEQGVVPMITWEPSSGPTVAGQPGYSPSRIARGACDAYLRRAAREAASFQHPFFVRLAPEMNGNWNSWGVRSGNSAAGYVAMWRHVVSIFREAGAYNVHWVWSPNVDGTASTKPFDAYYPGDAWVDDVALDGYNWGSVRRSTWLSFDQVFQASYEAMTRLTSKPLMIAETASTELGGSKAAWISEIPNALAVDMPRVQALVWFDVDKETDWGLGSSTSSLTAFRSLASSGVFSGPLSGLMSPVGQNARTASRHVKRVAKGRHTRRRGRSALPVGPHAGKRKK